MIMFCVRVLHQIVPKKTIQYYKISQHPENIKVMYSKLDTKIIEINGQDLTTKALIQFGDPEYKIKLSENTKRKIKQSRKFIESKYESKIPIYGVNTGIGNFLNVQIAPDQLQKLQYNIIRSHAAGVGEPLSLSRTRTLLALRINTLAKGYSGISLETLQSLIDSFNESCLSWIPEQGSLGASGDLAPLSHLALGLIGEGKMWSPKTGWDTAIKVLSANGLKPLNLKPKEGVSLINGTQFIASLGAEAVERANQIALQADVAAALSLQVLRGTCKAYDAKVHNVRPHKGQIQVAKRLRALLQPEGNLSEIEESRKITNNVQDAYSIRCCPQVHGVVHDTINFVRNIINIEINSVTDNPIIFAEEEEIISSGNFHGEYPAKSLDYLAVAVHELASISERRIERLVNPAHSCLPAFLSKDGGLNSGFMVTHCTAASLVAENKVLCHPSSVDSISTSAGQEDHVSMGAYSARKVLQVLDNVEHVIGIELLAACQGLEFLRPLHTTKPLENVYSCIRGVVGPLHSDRHMTPDIEKVRKLLQQNAVWSAVENYIDLHSKL